MRIQRLIASFATALVFCSMVGCGNSSDKKITGERDTNIVDSKERTTQDYYEKKVKYVALGDSHSAAITDDDCLYLWGGNYRGQLGDGTEDKRNTPVKIMNNVECVALGSYHSAAVTKDGGLYLWGSNKYGELGDGTENQRSTPIRIMDNVKSVTLGNEHSAAITDDGNLYVWGRNCAAISDDADSEVCNIPVKIMDNVKCVSLGSNHSASSAAGNHSAAVTETGELFMWGFGGSGQLGDGTRESHSAPVKIMDNVKTVSLGGDHSAAITEDGKLYLWGDNHSGQIGDRSQKDRFEPVKVMDNVKEVSLGDSHSAAVTRDGNLYLWGDNYFGQLGNSKSREEYTMFDDDIDSKEPVKILSNISTVSLGYEHSAAVTDDGVLYLWEKNNFGQIGSDNDCLFSHDYIEYGGLGYEIIAYINYPIQIIPNACN